MRMGEGNSGGGCAIVTEDRTWWGKDRRVRGWKRGQNIWKNSKEGMDEGNENCGAISLI